MERQKKILIGKEKEKKGNASQKKLPPAALVLLGDDHSGRDEMNLAGHPFALLQASGRTDENEIFSQSPRILPDGRLVTGKWHVTTPAAYGLPGPNEELLYLILLQLTREAADGGEWPAKVAFSRLNLIERLGWTNCAASYAALTLAFNRLSAVHIAAEHTFWDAHQKAPYASIGFGVLSSYAIADEPKGRKGQGYLPLSWFQWDDVLHMSFHAGNVRSLALDFAISLEYPTSRRLFRLLELLRHASKPPRPRIQIGLEKLRDRLGMTPYRYPSKIREKLESAHAELLARGYLAEVSFDKTREGETMAIYTFGKAGGPLLPSNTAKGSQNASNRPETASLAVDAGESKTDWAKRMSERFAAMPEDARLRLRDLARENVVPVFWDRVELPESPMSWGLWELVERETS